MLKLFNLLMYIVTLPVVMIITLFKSSEVDRGISYNSDQAISDSSAMMSGISNVYSKIDSETDKIVAAR